MYYLLLSNGRAVLRRDMTKYKSKKAVIHFADAPEDSEALITYSKRTIGVKLSGSKITLDLEHIRGDVSILLKSGNKHWICDKLYVGEDSNGEFYIASKACYGDMIASIYKDYESLREEFAKLKEEFTALKEKTAYSKDGYNII